MRKHNRNERDAPRSNRRINIHILMGFQQVIEQALRQEVEKEFAQRLAELVFIDVNPGYVSIPVWVVDLGRVVDGESIVAEFLWQLAAAETDVLVFYVLELEAMIEVSAPAEEENEDH